mgnify:CR=1 FL=1
MIDRKRGVLGSRLRTKLVFFLLGFVLFPALMMVYGSGAIIKRTVEAIVRTPVEEITRNASEIVDEWNDYLRQHSVRQAETLAATLGQGVLTDLPPPGPDRLPGNLAAADRHGFRPGGGGGQARGSRPGR